MTVWTFKTSSVFGNELLLDIALDGSNSFDNVEDSLSSMELRPRTGSPDTSVTESLNTLWQNMLKEKTQELDGINRSGKSFTMTVFRKLMGSETKCDILSIVRNDISQFYVRANDTSANRTEQNRTEQNRTEQNRTEQNRTEQIYTARPRLSLGRAVASHNRKASNLRVIRSYYSHIYKSRNGAYVLCSGISVFKYPRIIDK